MSEAATTASTLTTTLHELVMAAHFQVPLPLEIMDCADWASHFSDYPIVQQLPSLPLVNLPTPGQPLPQIELELGGLPRMLVRSSDGRFTLQLQGDRFAFGWRRLEPVGMPAQYPGFEVMQDMWKNALSRCEQWAAQRFQSQLQYRLVELTYSNAAPLDANGRQRRISDIFRFVQPGLRAVNMFAVNWAERVYPEGEAGMPFKGVVNSMAAMGQALGVHVLGFNFTGLAAVAPGEESHHIMKDLHDKIREIYKSVIVDAY